MVSFSLQQGAFLVKLARKAVENYLTENKILSINVFDEIFNIKRGVFTTIETYQIVNNTIHKELRGCIGFPTPIDSLINLVIKSAILSATEDPRFPPLEIEELDKVTFEVSILTNPELVNVTNKKDLPKHIIIGKDGLIIESGFLSGLLLPQVAVENEWDSETFLCNACIKAGLPPDAWLWKRTKVYKFQAQIFTEIYPKGKIIERKIYKP